MYRVDTYNQITWVFAVADPYDSVSLNTVLAATKAYVANKIRRGKKAEVGGSGGKLERLELEYAGKGFQDVFYLTRMQLDLPPSTRTLPSPSPCTMRLLREGGFTVGPTSPSRSTHRLSTTSDDGSAISPHTVGLALTTNSRIALPAIDVSIPSHSLDFGSQSSPTTAGRTIPARRYSQPASITARASSAETPFPVLSNCDATSDSRRSLTLQRSSTSTSSADGIQHISRPLNSSLCSESGPSRDACRLYAAVNISPCVHRSPVWNPSAGRPGTASPGFQSRLDPYATLPPVYGANTSLPSASQVARFERRQSEMLESLQSYERLKGDMVRVATPPPEYSRV